VPIVANQIDLICALQLIIVEGPLAAHIGGYLKRGWDKPWWSGVCALQACR
jgi:hypothetical protein